MIWRLLPGVLLSFGVSCSQIAPQVPPPFPSDRLFIELIHSTASGEACAPYDGGEICRDLAHWPLTIDHRLIRDWEESKRLLQGEADKWRGKDPNNPRITELRVWIHGGSQVPYGPPQRALNLCAAAGIFHINLGKPPP